MRTEIRESWKAIAAYTYMTICIFDFLVMPVYTSYLNQKFITDTVSELEPENRVYVLEVIDRISLDGWTPVTTNSHGGIVFHISFGMVLGGSALSGRTWTLSNNGVTSEPRHRDDKK